MNLLSTATLSCLSLMLVASCGKGPQKKPGTSARVTEAIQPDGSNVEGNYIAKLWPINLNLDQPEVGVANLSRSRDSFSASVNLKIGSPGAWHRQGIFSGTRCPNLNDDLNGDAYIDYEEAKRAMGQMLIPLDDDINTQESGRNTYPTANESGAYRYGREASFERLFADLKADDTDPNDNVMKLNTDEGLGLEAKVVIILGTTEATFLPNSVSSPYGSTPHKSLPIACGIIYKNFETPTDTTDDSTTTVEPVPTPTPTPSPTPVPTPTPVPHDNDEDEDNWYDRLRDWLRERF